MHQMGQQHMFTVKLGGAVVRPLLSATWLVLDLEKVKQNTYRLQTF